MKNVRPAFEVYDGDVQKLVGYQKIKWHFVFDIKLGKNFRRKARLVGGGHTTDPPLSLTYSSVVSRDSVSILLLVAAWMIWIYWNVISKILTWQQNAEKRFTLLLVLSLAQRKAQSWLLKWLCMTWSLVVRHLDPN